MSDLITLSISKEFGYVLATALLSTVINEWHGSVVMGWRAKAEVPYPNAYAAHAESPLGSPKYSFNCAQRAHSNYKEHLPQFYVSLLISGLLYPRLSAGMGITWLVSRIIYVKGYLNPSKEKGRGRYAAAPLMYPSQLGLWGVAGWVCWKLITG